MASLFYSIEINKQGSGCILMIFEEYKFNIELEGRM